jgi:hypothetical protein
LTINAYYNGGEMLSQMEMNRGTRGQLAGKDASGAYSRYAPEANAVTLEKLLDVPKWSAQKWSKNAQLIARIPEDKLRAKVAEIRSKHDEWLTLSAILGYARNLQGRDLYPPEPPAIPSR